MRLEEQKGWARRYSVHSILQCRRRKVCNTVAWIYFLSEVSGALQRARTLGRPPCCPATPRRFPAVAWWRWMCAERTRQIRMQACTDSQASDTVALRPQACYRVTWRICACVIAAVSALRSDLPQEAVATLTHDLRKVRMRRPQRIALRRPMLFQLRRYRASAIHVILR